MTQDSENIDNDSSSMMNKNAQASAEEIYLKVTKAIESRDFALAKRLAEHVAPSTETILGPLRWAALRDWGFASQNERGKDSQGKCILYDCSAARAAGVTFDTSGRVDVGVYVSVK